LVWGVGAAGRACGVMVKRRQEYECESIEWAEFSSIEPNSIDFRSIVDR
jgi:hypothetical protein